MPPQKKGKTGLKKGKISGKTLDTQRSLYQAELENLRKHLGLNEKQVLAIIEEMTKTKVPQKDSNNNNTDDKLKRKSEYGNDDNDIGTSSTPSKRSRKAKDEIDAEYNLLTQPRLTLEVNNQAQTFRQVNVSNSQNRSLWHAIQLLWLGRERDTGRTLVLKYPVHNRVQQLWDSVMHGSSNTPVYQAMHKLYSAMLEENEELEARIEDRRFGELSWKESDRVPCIYVTCRRSRHGTTNSRCIRPRNLHLHPPSNPQQHHKKDTHLRPRHTPNRSFATAPHRELAAL